jgi:iron(II)-dependent oxidoreductase
MDVKERIAAELIAARDRSLGLTVESLDESELTGQVSPLMSPLVWDLAHIGNYEEQWLLRAAAGSAAIRPEIDDLYDAFEHPRSTRPSLPLLSPDESSRYIAEVRRRVLDSLEHVTLSGPLAEDGFVYNMVIQHEHQHDETMLATHQLRKGGPALLDRETAGGYGEVGGAVTSAHVPGEARAGEGYGEVGGALRRGTGRLPREVLVPAGPFLMGTSTDPWAYDNERPGHVVDLPAFLIDTTPVSNAAYLGFVEDGGYGDPRFWHPGGRRWLEHSGKSTPAFWRQEGGQWLRRRFGRVEPLPMDEPVQHVCWYEADAYARWAGRRLPTEAEWEKAASWDPVADRKRRLPWGDADGVGAHANVGQRVLHPTPVGSHPEGMSAYGVHQMVGDVWEWTATDFHGYPKFRSFPYKEYSEVFFGAEYKVLKGGSWATHPLSARPTFRNWDYPIRRQIFAGFRCAKDA